MNCRIFAKVGGTIFLLIAALHLVRIIRGWEAVIAGWAVPMWLSWVALVVGLVLAWWGLSGKPKGAV